MKRISIPLLALGIGLVVAPSQANHDGTQGERTVKRRDLERLIRCGPDINQTLCWADCTVVERLENGNVRCACHLYTCETAVLSEGKCTSGRSNVYYETVDPKLETCGDPDPAK